MLRALGLRGLMLGALACAACAVVSHEEGIGLEISLTHQVGREPEWENVSYAHGAERGLLTDRGYGVTLERALIVIGELRLMACDESSAASAPRRDGGVWALLSTALSPGIAHAHGDSSPFVHATPVVFDLMDTDRNVRLLASMAPPPGRYCSMRLRVSAADEDAQGIGDAPDMVDRSVLVSGRYARSTERRDEHFEIATALDDVMDVAFPEPLELSEAEPFGHLLFELSYGAILNGVELSEPVEPLDELQVIRNLLTPISARVCSPDC